MEDDWRLLEEYARHHSEEAFRTLADRYASTVYHSALRQIGDPHEAEEVTQAVFIALAQKAGKIPRQTILYRWLFRATRYAVLNRLREDRSRRRREQEAFAMQNQAESEAASIWDQIAPLLDDALAALPEGDREAVMIRYFGEKSHKEVGVTLGVSEDTAKKRVSRAIERLRVNFARRGLIAPAAALAAALAANSAQAAPTGLSSTVAAAALAKLPVAPSSAALAKAVVKLMAWAKIKFAALAGVAVVVAAGTTTVAVRQIYRHSDSFWESPDFDQNTLLETPAQVTIVPAKFSAIPGRAIVTTPDADKTSNDVAQLMGLGVDLDGMLQFAHHGAGLLHVTPPDFPDTQYDFIANLPVGSRAALAAAIRRQFGYEARRETREITNAFTLTLDHADAPGVTVSLLNGPVSARLAGGKRVLQSARIADFADFLRSALDTVVVDETGLSNRYNLEFTLLAQPGDDHDKRIAWATRVLRDELGLRLTPSPGPHEVLVIAKIEGRK